MSAALFIVALALVLLWGWWSGWIPPALLRRRRRTVNVIHDAGGRWHCLLCQTVGYGGVTGWDEHYMAWHYTPKKKGEG